MGSLKIQMEIEIPIYIPDSLQQTSDTFIQEARLAMASKLYEMGRLSSGTAAELAGMTRIQFLHALAAYNVPMLDLADDELFMDIQHA